MCACALARALSWLRYCTYVGGKALLGAWTYCTVKPSARKHTLWASISFEQCCSPLVTTQASRTCFVAGQAQHIFLLLALKWQQGEEGRAREQLEGRSFSVQHLRKEKEGLTFQTFLRGAAQQPPAKQVLLRRRRMTLMMLA